MKTILKNAALLHKHWTRKLLPEPSREHVKSLCAAMAIGVKLPPIYIIETDKPEGGLVVAGWSRREAHKLRAVDVECVVISEDEAMNIALGENTNRQSYQFKYQTAWVYCPLAAKAVEVGHAARIAGLKAGPGSRKDNNILTGNIPATLEEVADLIGVSRPTLVKVKEVFDNIIAWDANHEPCCWGDSKEKLTALAYCNGRILDLESPCTPGEAWRGVRGKEATGGVERPAPRQLDLFIEGMASVAKWGKNFTKFEGQARNDAIHAIKKTVAALPGELREEIASEIRRLAREDKELKG
jgi:hypothetical protein